MPLQHEPPPKEKPALGGNGLPNKGNRDNRLMQLVNQQLLFQSYGRAAKQAQACPTLENRQRAQFIFRRFLQEFNSCAPTRGGM